MRWLLRVTLEFKKLNRPIQNSKFKNKIFEIKQNKKWQCPHSNAFVFNTHRSQIALRSTRDLSNSKNLTVRIQNSKFKKFLISKSLKKTKNGNALTQIRTLKNHVFFTQTHSLSLFLENHKTHSMVPSSSCLEDAKYRWEDVESLVESLFLTWLLIISRLSKFLCWKITFFHAHTHTLSVG